MYTFREFLRESIIDPKQETYSQQIFDHANTDDPILKDRVKKFIEFGIAELATEIKIVEYCLIGSIITKRYRDDADLDVNLLVETEMVDEDLWKLIGDASGKVIPGTQHQVNFHALREKSDYDKASEVADGVFDIKNNIFIRKSEEVEFDIHKYFGAFKTALKRLDLLKMELKHDLIDYDQLKDLAGEKITALKDMINQELKQIEQDVDKLIEFHKDVKQIRRDAFARPLSAQEVRDYGKKNALPENVVYKLLERYNYLAFLEKIEEIAGEDEKIDDGDVAELEKLVK